MSPGPTEEPRTNPLDRILEGVRIVGLVALALFTYSPGMQLDFCVWDDSVAIKRNARVHEGLSSESVQWAFTTGHFANWMPMTWLSYQSTVELFGPGPRGHHAVNL